MPLMSPRRSSQNLTNCALLRVSRDFGGTKDGAMRPIGCSRRSIVGILKALTERNNNLVDSLNYFDDDVS